MTEPGSASAQADVTISASCQEVYGLITDLPTMAELAAEADAMQWHRGDCARPGAVFKGHNRNGGRTWTTTCTVTAAEPGKVFAFDVKSVVIPVAHWRYDIEPVAGGCRVTERTWDRASANAGHIELTLQRLKARAEA